MLRTHLVTAFLVTLLTASCAKPLLAPTAVATAASTAVAVGAVVELDGSQSSDPNSPALPLAYHWRFKALPPGSQAKLNDGSLLTPSFTADVVGPYDIELTVSSAARLSDPVDLVVTAGPCGANPPSIAGVTATPTAPGVGSTVHLTATATDADNGMLCGLTQALRFAWRFVQLPAGSHAALNQPDAEDPSFRVDVAGDYQVELVVTDSTGRVSAPAQLKVTGSSCGAAVPSATVVATPSSPLVGVPVLLTSTVSDLDNSASPGCNLGQTFSWAWSMAAAPAGSRASLNSATATQPSFVPDLPGSYQLRLVVTDSTGLKSQPVDTTVMVGTCGTNAPSATVVASPSSSLVGVPVLLTSTVSDLDNSASPGCNLGQTFSWAWSMAAAPAGSRASLNSATASQPSFVPDLPGTYQVRLVVTDSTGLRSPPVETTVTVGTCGTNAPSATVLASPSSSLVGAAVLLTPTVSDLDNTASPGCNLGQTFTYAWSMAAAPAGSRASLNSATASQPSFVPDLPGSYQVRLVVTDSTGLRSQPMETTVTVGTCGTNAPSATVAANPSSSLVGAPVLFTPTVSDADNAAPCSLGQTFTYAWSLAAAPTGSRATLNSLSAVQPSFVPDLPGSYQVSLVVTDSTGLKSQPVATGVNVSANCAQLAPVAGLASVRAGRCSTGGIPCTVTPTSTPTLPSTAAKVVITAIPSGGWQDFNLQLDASNTLNGCGLASQTLSYLWEVTAAPLNGNWNWQPALGGGGFTATQSTLVNPTLQLFVPGGIYTVRLIVSDGSLASTPMLIEIHTN